MEMTSLLVAASRIWSLDEVWSKYGGLCLLKLAEGGNGATTLLEVAIVREIYLRITFKVEADF